MSTRKKTTPAENIESAPVEDQVTPELDDEPTTAPADVEDEAAEEASYDLAEADGDDLEETDDTLDDEDFASEDSLTFSNGVIEKIVALAVRDVPGVLGMKGGWINRMQETFGASSPTKGVTVEVMPDNSVRVNLSVFIEYGSYAPKIFEDVKKVVVKEVTGMTGLEVGGVNLRIEDVLTPEEYKGAKARQDAEDAAAAAGDVPDED